MLMEVGEDLARELFPAGRLDGPHWRVGSLDGEPGQSMAITVRGAKKGLYKDFSAGAGENGGDMLDLVRRARCGGDMAEAVRWAKSWLGISDAPVSQASARRDREAAERRRAAERAAEEAETKKRRARAQAIYLEARPALRGTPAADYLAGRGVSLAAIGRQPGCLRYHPALYNAERGQRWPALVAAITGPGGEFYGVHRTWLDVRGGGRVVKAPLAQPRKAMGSIMGGCIRLWRGLGEDGKRRPPLSQARAGEDVVLVEGVEDGLSAILGVPQHRILVAVSLANMSAVVLPEAIRRVYLAKENDTAPAAIAAFERAVQAHQAAGREVVVVRAAGGAKDLNDVLMGKAG
jgi:hypothetical protein